MYLYFVLQTKPRNECATACPFPLRYYLFLGLLLLTYVKVFIHASYHSQDPFGRENVVDTLMPGIFRWGIELFIVAINAIREFFSPVGLVVHFQAGPVLNSIVQCEDLWVGGLERGDSPRESEGQLKRTNTIIRECRSWKREQCSRLR